MADEAYADLEDRKQRALANADLQFYQVGGQESRADFNMLQGLLSGQFGQQMGGSELALQQLGALGGAIGQGEGFDVNRRAGELQRTGMQASDADRQFNQAMQLLMANEQIPTNRFQLAQNPYNTMLSALSGVNVAPQTINPPQFAPPGPSGWEQFGNFAGQAALKAIPFIPGLG